MSHRRMTEGDKRELPKGVNGTSESHSKPQRENSMSDKEQSQSKTQHVFDTWRFRRDVMQAILNEHPDINTSLTAKMTLGKIGTKIGVGRITLDQVTAPYKGFVPPMDKFLIICNAFNLSPKAYFKKVKPK